MAQQDTADDAPSDFDGFDDNHNETVTKDSDEEDLERAVFGDQEGFDEGIEDLWNGHSAKKAGSKTQSEPKLEENGGEDDLEGVADDAVGHFLERLQYTIWLTLSFCSCSSSTLEPCQQPNKRSFLASRRTIP